MSDKKLSKMWANVDRLFAKYIKSPSIKKFDAYSRELRRTMKANKKALFN